MLAIGSSQVPHRLRPREGGFTYVELLTVIVTLLIVVAIAIPRAGSVVQNLRLRGAAWQLAGDLRLARQRAVTLRTSVRICISGCAITVPTPIQAYSVEVYKGTPAVWVNETGALIALPQDVGLSGNVNTVGFGSTGTADAGTFTVRNVQGCYGVVVGWTGQVQANRVNCP